MIVVQGDLWRWIAGKQIEIFVLVPILLMLVLHFAESLVLSVGVKHIMMLCFIAMYGRDILRTNADDSFLGIWSCCYSKDGWP